MATYVGRWDCPTCGNKGIHGPETRCPNCGSPRPKDVRFYLPSDAAKVADETQLKEAKAGVDWICGHCGSQNKAADTDCFSCGNPRDDSSQDVDLQERDYFDHEVPQESFKRERTQHPLERQRTQAPKRKSPLRILIPILLILGGGFFFLRTFPKTIDVTVTTFSWKRAIKMAHYEPVSRDGWNLPQGAYDVRKSREIRTYKQVLRGYETKTRQVKVQTGTRRYVCGKIDKGNGYFVDKYCTEPTYDYKTETYKEPVYDQVPVYDTKYYYKIKDWISKSPLKAAAQDNNAQWPHNPYINSRDWKETGRSEQYYIIVQENNGTTHYEKLDYNRWSQLDYGSTLKAQKSYLFNWYYGLK